MIAQKNQPPVYWVSSHSQGVPFAMITFQDLTHYIRQSLADAEVSVVDRTGTMDHFTVKVISDGFKEKNLLDRHRMIYQALDVPMKDGRIHALEIQAKTREEAKGG
jgi:stress-induced morphogen